ncbi:MAG: hypothetical protein JW706_07830 [Opitutales bacterium]|nr:hypothetical protein [Opitutales bacterium]
MHPPSFLLPMALLSLLAIMPTTRVNAWITTDDPAKLLADLPELESGAIDIIYSFVRTNFSESMGRIRSYASESFPYNELESRIGRMEAEFHGLQRALEAAQTLAGRQHSPQNGLLPGEWELWFVGVNNLLEANLDYGKAYCKAMADMDKRYREMEEIMENNKVRLVEIENNLSWAHNRIADALEYGTTPKKVQEYLKEEDKVMNTVSRCAVVLDFMQIDVQAILEDPDGEPSVFKDKRDVLWNGWGADIRDHPQKDRLPKFAAFDWISAWNGVMTKKHEAYLEIYGDFVKDSRPISSGSFLQDYDYWAGAPFSGLETRARDLYAKLKAVK